MLSLISCRSVQISVPDGDNVGLHGSIGGVGGGACDHDALVEVACGAVGVIPARGQNDGPLLAHWPAEPTMNFTLEVNPRSFWIFFVSDARRVLPSTNGAGIREQNTSRI